MKLTREQVDEILKKASSMSVGCEGHTIMRMALESFIEKEYKCIQCGEKTISTEAFVCCQNPKCLQEHREIRIDGMACYKDDWNGGKV